MTTLTIAKNSTANNAITASKPKFLVKDATIPFLSPLERYLEKAAKAAGLELITLCNPRLYVANGLLHVTRVEGSNALKIIKGVTLADMREEGYHTPANGWIARGKECYFLAEGAEFIINGKHYIYHAHHAQPLWAEAGYLNGDKTKYSTKRRFENSNDLEAWRVKTGFAVNVIRLLPVTKSNAARTATTARVPVFSGKRKPLATI